MVRKTKQLNVSRALKNKRVGCLCKVKKQNDELVGHLDVKTYEWVFTFNFQGLNAWKTMIVANVKYLNCKDGLAKNFLLLTI